MSTGASAEVQFTVSAPKLTGLVLTGCMLGLDQLGLIGDVSPASEAALHDVELNPISPSAQTVTLVGLPQGIYSQLEFDVEHVWLEGAYQGTPLTVRVDVDGPRVDLRATPPQELLDHDLVRLPVAVDADAWWQDVDWAGLDRVDGKIIIDATHNAAVTQSITRDIGNCFTLGAPIH